MEGEIVFYDLGALEKAWDRLLQAEDTISPLGQLYAEYNANQRRTIDEYDESRRRVERYSKEVIWPSRECEAGPAVPAFDHPSDSVNITYVSVSIESGVEDLTTRGGRD